MMAQEEKSEDNQSYYNSSWADHECLYQISWRVFSKMFDFFFNNAAVYNRKYSDPFTFFQILLSCYMAAGFKPK